MEKLSIKRIVLLVILCTGYIYVYWRGIDHMYSKANSNPVYMYAKFCGSDVINVGMYSRQLYILACFIIMLIIAFKSEFRVNVLCRYSTRSGWLKSVYIKLIKVIAIFVGIITFLNIAMLFIHKPDTLYCNWKEWNSYIQIFNGAMETQYTCSVLTSCVLCAARLAAVLFVTGTIIIICWSVKTPLIGTIVCIMAYIYKGRMIIYGTEINLYQLALTGVDYKSFFVIPIVWSIGIIALNYLYLRKKDILEW